MNIIKPNNDLTNNMRYGQVSGSKSYNSGWTAIFRINFDPAFSTTPKIFVTANCQHIGAVVVDQVSTTTFRIVIYTTSSGTFDFSFYWLAIAI